MRKVLFGCVISMAMLASGIAQAQSSQDLLKLLDHSAKTKSNAEILESLMIPDHLALSGIQAISKVTGKYVSVDQGYTILVYQFAEDGTVHVERGAPDNDSFDGTWRNEEEKTCFLLGAGPEFCGIVELDGTQFTFVAPDGQRFSGPVFELGPPPPRMAADAKLPDGIFCDKINSIAKGGADKFESLIDPDREPAQVNDFSDPFRWSTIWIGDDYCSIGEGVFGKEHECMLPFDKGDPKADEAYQETIQQIPLCLANSLKSSDVDSQLKYESSAQLHEKGERETGFVTHDGVNFRVTLQGRSICSDMLTCSEKYGVWIGASVED
jgi:hypothetical protein